MRFAIHLMSAARARILCSFMAFYLCIRTNAYIEVCEWISKVQVVFVITKAKNQKAFVFGVLALFLPSALRTLIGLVRDDQ